MKKKKSEEKRVSNSFFTGAIALIFLVIGYQTALFVQRAAIARIAANRDEPDTVFVCPEIREAGGKTAAGFSGNAVTGNRGVAVTGNRGNVMVGNRGANMTGNQGNAAVSGKSSSENRTFGNSAGGKTAAGFSGNAVTGNRGAAVTGNRGNAMTGNRRNAAVSGKSPSENRTFGNGAGGASAVYRKESGHGAVARRIRREYAERKHENFHFDPNTVSIEDLQRLGFSRKQAESIDRYRLKGARFRRKSDFARVFVVSDTIYARLEPYIDIPKIDVNTADSALFDTLPGIGSYFASKMVSHRRELGGYSSLEQLMDIKYFDREKFDALSDLLCLSEPQPYPLWTLPADSLRRHPYIDAGSARSIVFFREHNPVSAWTLEQLRKAGVLTPEACSRLSRCRLASP